MQSVTRPSSPPPEIGSHSVAQRIAQARPQLSRLHRQVADVVLAQPLQVATLSIDELAARAGVSIATANRFARALGFDGYAAFRGELVRGFEALLAPVEQLRSQVESGPASAADVFASALEECRHNIEATRQSLSAGACEAAVRLLREARTVYIAGYGASAWLGGLLQHGLETYGADARLLASTAGATHGARALARSGPQDVVVAISFPRYLADTLALAEQARARRVPVLAITDHGASPLAPLADVVLFAQARSRFSPNCESSVLALIEALVSALSLQTHQALQAVRGTAEVIAPWIWNTRTGRRGVDPQDLFSA